VKTLKKPSDRLFKFAEDGLYNFVCDVCALPTKDYGQNTFERFAKGSVYTQILCNKHAEDLKDSGGLI
jgi:hypothetical protein